MQNGDVNTWATDINNIPAPLIQRVEVLTGGASAVYGSDAIAGVVNFIMNDHFEGIQFDYNFNGYNHNQHSWVGDLVAARAVTNPAQFAGSGQRRHGRADERLLGDDGRQLRQRQGQRHRLLRIPQCQRGAAGCPRLQRLLARPGPPTDYTCGGSSTSFPGRFTDFSNFDFTIANAQGGTRPYVGATDAVQLRPDQLLSASRHALSRQLLRALRRRRRTCGCIPNSTS